MRAGYADQGQFSLPKLAQLPLHIFTFSKSLVPKSLNSDILERLALSMAIGLKDSSVNLCMQALSIPGPTVYLAAAYWSLTTVATIGFGDILPVTNAERAVMLLVQITGVLFFGILLGSITSLLQVGQPPAGSFQILPS